MRVEELGQLAHAAAAAPGSRDTSFSFDPLTPEKRANVLHQHVEVQWVGW